MVVRRGGRGGGGVQGEGGGLEGAFEGGLSVWGGGGSVR